MDGVLEEQVRLRAYEIWVDLGRAHGQAHDHWIAAERDLKAPPAKPKRARATVAPVKAAAPKALKTTATKVPPVKVAKPKKVARAADPSSAFA